MFLHEGCQKVFSVPYLSSLSSAREAVRESHFQTPSFCLASFLSFYLCRTLVVSESLTGLQIIGGGGLGVVAYIWPSCWVLGPLLCLNVQCHSTCKSLFGHPHPPIHIPTFSFFCLIIFWYPFILSITAHVLTLHFSFSVFSPNSFILFSFLIWFNSI